MNVRLTSLLGAAICAASLACTTPGNLGERRYREGDRQAALETWRKVGEESHEYENVQRRIAAVENEFEQLVVRYQKRASYYERNGRLAEAALHHRLVLEFRPEDREGLQHLQRLVRDLETRKKLAEEAFEGSMEAGELRMARLHLQERERLDPFDSELHGDRRDLEIALRGEVDRFLETGRGHFDRAEFETADRAFAAVLELDPENGTARGYRSFIRDLVAEPEVGEPPVAALILKPLSQEQIRAEGSYQNAVAAEKAGRPYDAIRHDMQALRLYPKHRKSRLHLAAIRRALEPEVPELIESGRSHYQQEDLSSALDQWRRVLLIDPNHSETQEYVVRAERLLENLEQLRGGPPAVSTRR